MARPAAEDLRQYINRIMLEKGLNFQQVGELSDGAITEGYVRKITSGEADNPSVKKLKALASGLGVSEDEIFNVARGLPAAEGGAQSNIAESYHVILKLMTECWKNRVLINLLREIAKLNPTSQEQALRMLKVLNRRQEAVERNRKAK